jgi:hypothetical protein
MNGLATHKERYEKNNCNRYAADSHDRGGVPWIREQSEFPFNTKGQSTQIKKCEPYEPGSTKKMLFR